MSPGVVQEIETAFSETSLPPEAMLMNNHCWECIETSRLFWNAPRSFATWQEAVRRAGARVEAALLTPQAWRYYLPALMIWCVRDTEEVDVLVDNLVNELTPPAGAGNEWFAPRARGFTTEQRRAICSFLAWYQAREESQWGALGSEPPSEVSSALDHWRAAE